MTRKPHYMDYIPDLCNQDREMARKGYAKYRDSCLKRGGAGIFMMLARKWDRIDEFAEQHGYDLFEALRAAPPPDGLLDDIRDLRVYLLIAEAEYVRRCCVVQTACATCGNSKEQTEVTPGVSCPDQFHAGTA